MNDELSQLERAVEEFCDILAPGGRLCIITFHSLEDRIVKEIFSRRANPCTCPREFPICVCGKKADIKKITGKPFVPDAEETEENPTAARAEKYCAVTPVSYTHLNFTLITMLRRDSRRESGVQDSALK